MELSLSMRSIPMFPVFGTCVPPHSSTLDAYLTTRTLSPYFSPNRAIAPILRASSIGISRCSSSNVALRIRLLTRCSTLRNSSFVTFWKCEKSKRRMSGLTYEPFCSTCVPSMSRRASCRRWVAE